MVLGRYLFWKTARGTLTGSFLAIVVLLGLQFLRLSDLIVRNGLELESVLTMMGGLALSFTPLVFPIALLFTLLSLFGRMASDRELIALLAMGRSPWSLLKHPALFAVFMTAASLVAAFYVGPYGNRQFEESIDEAFKRKVASALRSGTFSEDFLGLVVFVENVEPIQQILERVFIFDEETFKDKVAISAKNGKWIESSEMGVGTLLLENGVVASLVTEGTLARRINFKEYRINADFTREAGQSRNSPPSLNAGKLLQLRVPNKDSPGEDLRPIWVEIARRFAVALVCVLFVPLAFGLSFDSGRTVKGRAVFLGLTILMIYWTLYFAIVTWLLKSSWIALRNYEFLSWVIIWIPNLLALFIGLWAFNARAGIGSKAALKKRKLSLTNP